MFFWVYYESCPPSPITGKKHGKHLWLYALFKHTFNGQILKIWVLPLKKHCFRPPRKTSSQQKLGWEEVFRGLKQCFVKKWVHKGLNSGLGSVGTRSFQKNAKFLSSFAFFSKELNVLVFFCILYKRMQHSLKSFTFFIKECGVLWVLLHSL